jgi:hypothetical protein
MFFFSPSFSETSQHSTAHEMKGITFAKLTEIEVNVAEEFPLNNIMWKPSMIATKYRAWYYVNVIFLHLIPGLLIDGLIKLSGNKPLYVEIHCIIYIYIYIYISC